MRIYPLKHTSEEVIAVAGAKCSRSAEPFDQIMAGISEEMAGDFHKKFVIGYGHASVAEMAIPMIALEGVSIVASKMLESQRRGAYQERSTRYQDFSKREVYEPVQDDLNPASVLHQEITKEEIELYKKATTIAFDAYEALMPKMMDWAEKVVPADVPNRKGAVRGRAFDSLRYLLPCGTKTSLAMRLNARDLATLIQQLRSHRLPEFRDIGIGVLEAATQEVPSLVKHVVPKDFLINTDSCLKEMYNVPISGPQPTHSGGPHAKLVAYDEDGELKIAASLLYRFSGWPYDVCRKVASRYRARIYEQLGVLMAGRQEHDPVPIEFEAARYTFDVVMDFGAYRDLQRHRRCTILPQQITPSLGYVVPADIQEAGLAIPYKNAMEDIGNYANLLEMRNCYLSQYATALGFLHRSTHIYDLAQAYYVIELRTKPQGHISYRKIAEEMYNEIKHVHSFLTQWIKCVPTTKIGAHS